ncbi:MAG: hypothetical protein QOE30_3863 [Mycobacterium sp.]|uniref:hypothetical protein n=1 Tax=Mycobacterium sp. TaxID=1785 RepID=UPI0028B72A04|nr:hypothetical protein [Mycobacterium sp.]MDT5118124.1 hypothetical protein [Mycobacterium sp.]
MTELTPAAPAEGPSDLRAASLLRGASSFLAAFGGLLLFATGMAADSTAAMAAGIVVGVSGSASVYVLSWALRVRRGCPGARATSFLRWGDEHTAREYRCGVEDFPGHTEPELTYPSAILVLPPSEHVSPSRLDPLPQEPDDKRDMHCWTPSLSSSQEADLYPFMGQPTDDGCRYRSPMPSVEGDQSPQKYGSDAYRGETTADVPSALLRGVQP